MAKLMRATRKVRWSARMYSLLLHVLDRLGKPGQFDVEVGEVVFEGKARRGTGDMGVDDLRQTGALGRHALSPPGEQRAPLGRRELVGEEQGDVSGVNHPGRIGQLLSKQLLEARLSGRGEMIDHALRPTPFPIDFSLDEALLEKPIEQAIRGWAFEIRDEAQLVFKELV